MKCKICNRELISPTGNEDSIALIITDKPSIDPQTKESVLITCDEKRLLKTFLGMEGIPFEFVRITSLWLHEPNVKDAEDKEWNYQQAMLEAMDRKIVLLLGTTTTKFFVKENATNVSGLKLKSQLLSAPYIYGTRTLRDAMRYPIGEFEITMREFTKIFMKLWKNEERL